MADSQSTSAGGTSAAVEQLSWICVGSLFPIRLLSTTMSAFCRTFAVTSIVTLATMRASGFAGVPSSMVTFL
ncbi:hypothetical protein [Lysobacter gummosus]|uniref:hypothetical protein n=1 Tax=Lysobacter gummosus TaxID=262324 RepID=UPI003639B0B4